MRNELSEHHLPPLSTRMIFLHHRVRLYDHASQNDAHAGGTNGDAISPVALTVLAALLLAVAGFLGALHA